MKKPGILWAVLVLGLCVSAYPRTLSLGLSSGLFFAKNTTYWDIYGLSIPLEAELRLGMFRNLGLAAGISCVRDSGQAVNVNRGSDGYPVRIRMVSFPFSAYIQFPLDGVSLVGGAGLSFHSYEETWQTVSISHKGNTTKPFVYAGAECRVLPRIAARLTLRYETITAGKNPFLANEINLGGLTLLAGVSVRIF